MEAVHPSPFVTDVRATAFVACGRQQGVNLTYYDQEGGTVAHAFSSIEDVERHAFDLLSIVDAARYAGRNVRFGKQPRVRSKLMRELVVSETREADTVLDTPPKLGVFDRILASIPQVQA